MFVCTIFVSAFAFQSNQHRHGIAMLFISGWFEDSSPGRAVRKLPAPPQIRTCGFPASGSSADRFANYEHKVLEF